MRTYKTIKFLLVICGALALVSSCHMDLDDHPFTVGFGITIRFNAGPNDPIRAGEKFALGMSVMANSVTDLTDADIRIMLPPEIEIEQIIAPRFAPKVVREENTVIWKGDFKRSLLSYILPDQTNKELTIWVKSKTDWEQWSNPIEVPVSLNFRAAGGYRNYPAGYYSKKISLSHNGLINNTIEWDESPNGYRGVWE